MSRKNPHFIRKIQRFLLNSGEQVTFRSAHITQGSRLTLLGILISCISLFFSWVSSFDGSISSSSNDVMSFWSFSAYIGYVGFFIFVLLALSSFSILSTVRKEKIRFFTLIQLSDTLCCLCSSLIIFILTLQSYFFIQGLQMFSANILYGKGLILCLTGSLLMFFGSLMIRNEYRKNIKGSYIHEAETKNQYFSPESKKDNMTLPF